jgi:hypothetical protein
VTVCLAAVEGRWLSPVNAWRMGEMASRFGAVGVGLFVEQNRRVLRRILAAGVWECLVFERRLATGVRSVPV